MTVATAGGGAPWAARTAPAGVTARLHAGRFAADALHGWAVGDGATILAAADGELLVVPQSGRLRFVTECGVLIGSPGEIVGLPRGMVFRVGVLDGSARGGSVVALRRELKVPIRFLGVGEGAEDLAGFAPARFAEGLLAD